VVWVVASLLFAGGIYYLMGEKKALEFLAGYLIEKSLSADNIFVFIMIFAYFDVTTTQQPRVLKWGIIGAVIMRAVLIAAGVTLIQRFHWMTYVFGLLLLMTVVKMVLQGDEKFDPENNWALKLLRRFMPITKRYYDVKFFVRAGRRFLATPLLLVLVVVESSDLIFALDSIPAIFAVTYDPFIIYTSNIFAILGLRALYFVLAGAARVFHYLKPGIITILAFVALKMLIVDFYKIPIGVSLGVIGAVLTVSVIASLLRLRRNGHQTLAQPDVPASALPMNPAKSRTSKALTE
jgi:tellurite resistance protein TerC